MKITCTEIEKQGLQEVFDKYFFNRHRALADRARPQPQKIHLSEIELNGRMVELRWEVEEYRANYGETYFFVAADGSVQCKRFYSDATDMALFKVGNGYETRTLAEEIARKILQDYRV